MKSKSLHRPHHRQRVTLSLSPSHSLCLWLFFSHDLPPFNLSPPIYLSPAVYIVAAEAGLRLLIHTIAYAYEQLSALILWHFTYMLFGRELLCARSWHFVSIHMHSVSCSQWNNHTLSQLRFPGLASYDFCFASECCWNFSDFLCSCTSATYMQPHSFCCSAAHSLQLFTLMNF